uniref:CCH-01 n=1 Tax=Bruguiera gymnorhiza TaxID=39984 RepID=Q58F51_BRUGY|nr:CCH-01 [Bruguiera gymnorhiza]
MIQISVRILGRWSQLEFCPERQAQFQGMIKTLATCCSLLKTSNAV